MIRACIFFVLLGLVGTMERRDQEAVEEFRREWVAVQDEAGTVHLVRVKEVGDGDFRCSDTDSVRHLPE